ncbi:PHB depolymerase family esterase [Mesorhizobium sp. RP14(2022)]|uniref:PHB depolymerase family esterase n=1 Tax=Mesorhizobium liriopis TaxID=2953882 RepID=A0ABT1CBU7_9HYPH|nr:PHB depolymerase family esterase [Mesorhizobium liriopis]MCO6052289.1 PHB depolymerase family esterase [Mesorhizobium liriopis]
MRSMSDTIQRLSALRSCFEPVGKHAPANRLKPFAWTGQNPGNLKASAYIPQNLERGTPLVVVLHGCTQSAAAYDHGSGWSALADRTGFALLFPEQQRSNNANLCFNWFEPEDTRRGAGEVRSIAEMIDAFATEYGIDRSRVFITGLSAGGAMTSAVLATYPELFAGGAIIAGLPFGVADSIPQAFDRMRGHGGPTADTLADILRQASTHPGPWPILSVWHGDADQTVAASNMDNIVAQWRGLHGAGTLPALSETVDSYSHRVWRDSKGRDAIETYAIAGMGHGTPLGTAGVDGYGSSGPFMLDVGISSTLRIAQFWGIAKLRTSTPKGSVASEQAATLEPLAMQSELPPRLLRDVKVMKPADTPPKSGVQRTIEDALRAAGLTK